MSKIDFKKSSENKRRFLLGFFSQESPGYGEIRMNGFWLIKRWNGKKKLWTVDIFTEESYENYKTGNNVMEFDEDTRERMGYLGFVSEIQKDE